MNEATKQESVMDQFGPMRPLYLNYAMKTFQKQLAYKFEYFVGVFNGLLFIFIFTSVWTNIFSDPALSQSTPFTSSSIVSYAVFAMIIRISMTVNENEIAGKVRTGAIAMDLIKPVNYTFLMFADSIGQSMFHWITRVIPILLICLLAFDVALPRDMINYPLMIVSWTFGYLIMFYMDFAFALLAFWFVETFSFQLMKYGLLTLLAGGILPIDFFPAWARPIIAFLPFQYIIYAPTSLFIGHIKGEAALRMLAVQGVWVLLLAGICHWMWNTAQKKLILQGG